MLGNYRRWAHDSERLVDWIGGACMLVRREVVEQVGGFDERFFLYAEETDWQRRMRDGGWEIAFTPAVEVTHLGGASGASTKAQTNRHFFDSLDRYERKHHGLAGLLSLRCAMIAGCGMRAVLWSLTWLLRPRQRAAGRRKNPAAFVARAAPGHPPVMIYVAAAFYAVFFWLLAFRRPGVALALIFATAPFQNDLSAGGPVKFSISEINLILAVPVLLLRAPRLVLGPIVWPVLLYFAIGAASSVLHWHDSTLTCFVQMALYLLVAVAMFASLPREPEDLQLALRGLVATGVFLALAVMILRSNYVLGLHKNGVGSSLSCALLVALELWFAAEPGRAKWLLSVALAVIGAGLLATFSRGAWLGAFCGIAVLLTLRREFAVFFRAGLVLVPVIVIAWQFLPQESRTTATGFERSRGNIEARYQTIEIAREYFHQDPVLGLGVGLRKEFDATNLVWVTLAETGVAGRGSAAADPRRLSTHGVARPESHRARRSPLHVAGDRRGAGGRPLRSWPRGSLLDARRDDARMGGRGDGDLRLVGNQSPAGGRRGRARTRTRTRKRWRRTSHEHQPTPYESTARRPFHRLRGFRRHRAPHARSGAGTARRRG